MSALEGISLNSKISLIIAGLIMMTFFAVQTCIVFGICEPSLTLAKFGWGCVVFFMPPFFKVVSEFLQNKASMKKDLNKKNIYLEHAAKIIRHDMHSGINTYLPRGIKSLKRRLDEDQIKEMKIGSPLKLIEDGLHHAQKVYSGVYEFTNLVKVNAQMSKQTHNIKDILADYLRLTAYKNQVILDDNLPTGLEVNEALFCTAVDNLIRNGLKYNDSPTKWVKIYLGGNYNEDTYIAVEDNGRGITQEEFVELSKPYTRKEGQKEMGTGLGLNICIQILKEHNFSVKAEKTDSGTKIKIFI
jgi:light-regulated signal transduction histidine kinase (bacteriophytochrome)